MAKIVTYNVNKDKDDRSLVDYLYGKRGELGDWSMYMARDSFVIPEISQWLLLVISSKDIKGTDGNLKRIAAIPVDDPFKIILFDGSGDAYTAIWGWVKDFKSDKTVIIEIQ